MTNNNQMWTEIWGTNGLCDDIEGATCLSADTRTKLTAYKAFAAAQDYTKGFMDSLLIGALVEVMQKEPGSTTD